MNKEDLYEAMGNINEKRIHAAHAPKAKKKPVWVKWGAMAACLALMVMTIGIPLLSDKTPQPKTYDSIAMLAEIPIEYADGCFVVDINNPREIVGWADYVFVAKVEAELRTEYGIDNDDNFSMPYTVYSITVVDNIKGNLTTNEVIEFFKHGGVNYDETSISLLEGDQLLESGKYYILAAVAQSDGRLGQGMPNAMIELSISDVNELTSNEDYIKYITFVENEILVDRERFHSSYDAE